MNVFADTVNSSNRPRDDWRHGVHPSNHDCNLRTRRKLFSVYVGRLPLDISKEELYDLFKGCGMICEIFISTPEPTMQYTYAFVRYSEMEAAEQAVQDLNLWPMQGKSLRVELAQETRPERSGREPLLASKAGHYRPKTENSDDMLNLWRLKQACYQFKLSASKETEDAGPSKESEVYDIKNILEEMGKYENSLCSPTMFKGRSFNIDIDQYSQLLSEGSFSTQQETQHDQQTAASYLSTQHERQTSPTVQSVQDQKQISYSNNAQDRYQGTKVQNLLCHARMQENTAISQSLQRFQDGRQISQKRKNQDSTSQPWDVHGNYPVSQGGQGSRQTSQESTRRPQDSNTCPLSPRIRHDNRQLSPDMLHSRQCCCQDVKHHTIGGEFPLQLTYSSAKNYVHMLNEKGKLPKDVPTEQGNVDNLDGSVKKDVMYQNDMLKLSENTERLDIRDHPSHMYQDKRQSSVDSAFSESSINSSWSQNHQEDTRSFSDAECSKSPSTRNSIPMTDVSPVDSYIQKVLMGRGKGLLSPCVSPPRPVGGLQAHGPAGRSTKN